MSNAKKKNDKPHFSEQIMQSKLEEKHHHHSKRLLILVPILFLIFILIIFIYGFKSSYYNDITQDSQFQDYLLMVLLMTLGFGMMLGSLRKLAWSALIATVYVFSINILLGPILQKFWYNVFQSSFSFNQVTQNNNIYDKFRNYNQTQKIRPSLFLIRLTIQTAISFLISMYAYIGRINTILLTFASLVFLTTWNLAYYINVHISFNLSWNNKSFLIIFDDFGCNNVFLFGALFGIGFSKVLSCKFFVTRQSRLFQPSRDSLIFSMIGTGVVISLFPYLGQLHPKRDSNLGAMNMYFTLTASILSCCAASCLFKAKLGIHEIVYGVFGGGVMIGTVGGLIDNISGSLSIGLLAGIASAIWYNYLFFFVNKKDINDSLGLTGTFLICSLFGSVVVGPGVVASYVSTKKVLFSYVFQNFFDSIMLITYAIITGVIGLFSGMICAAIGSFFGKIRRKQYFQESMLLPRTYTKSQYGKDVDPATEPEIIILEEKDSGRGYSLIRNGQKQNLQEEKYQTKRGYSNSQIFK